MSIGKSKSESNDFFIYSSQIFIFRTGWLGTEGGMSRSSR